jgi:DNA-binding transcriptional MocR family regulator
MDPNKPGVKAAVARFQAKQIERDPSLRTSASDFAQLDAVDTKAADAAKIEPAVSSKIAAAPAAAPVPSTPASAPNADVIAQAAVKKETEQPVAPPPKEADTEKFSTTINNNIQQTAANDSNPSLSWSEKVMGYYSLQDQVKMGSAHFSMA